MNKIESENIKNFKRELKELLKKYNCFVVLLQIQCVDFVFPKEHLYIVTDILESSTFE